MDKINKTIKEKKQVLTDCYNKIEEIKKEIRLLEEQKYLMCDHKFQLYPVYSGPYPERQYICTNCGYIIENMV